MGAASEYHLEVHVVTHATGKVVSDAKVTIAVRDETTGGSSVKVPVAIMRGVAAGPSDIHYGNNVTLTPGHAYHVQVRVNDQVVHFAFTLGNM